MTPPTTTTNMQRHPLARFWWLGFIGLLGISALLTSCNHEVRMTDFGDHSFGGDWNKDTGVGIVLVEGKRYSGKLTPGQGGEVVFTSDEGDPIVCTAVARVLDSADGSCTVRGERRYSFSSSRPYATYGSFVLATHGKYKVHKGSFSTLTGKMSLNVEDVRYAGTIGGKLFSSGDVGGGLLRSADGRSLRCLLTISATGAGVGYCTDRGGRYELDWMQGFHI